MDGINEAINSFGDMLNTIGSKMETVFDGVKMLEDVITQAIEEDCEFECANGKNHFFMCLIMVPITWFGSF